MTELSLRIAQPAAPATMPVQANRPRLPPMAQGKGQNKLTAVLGYVAYGSRAGRTEISDDKAQTITGLTEAGLAAPVAVTANGRTLNGNFFSAEGHNLKQNNGQPDTTRPLVLFLSGSGGSAEDQGTDIAQFYQKSGASVLAMNYGGFGGSTPMQPTENSLFEDSQAMLQHAIDLGYDPENIVIHGYSLGGAIAGNLKESMEAGTDSTGAPVKMRGLVLDRPMVSMSAGVKARLPGFTRFGPAQAAGQISRKALGTFSARSAVTNSTNVDTPIIVTSDEGLFASDADRLRTRLNGQQRPGAPTGGTRTNRNHFDHAAVLTADGNALKGMVGTTRTGATQALASGKPATALATTNELRTQVTLELDTIQTAIQTSQGTLGQHATSPIATNVMSAQVAIANVHLRKVKYIVANVPDAFLLVRARTYVKQLCALQTRYLDLLAQANAPMTPPPDLVDAVEQRCRDAGAAFTTAGGAQAAPRQVQDEVIAAQTARGQLRGATLNTNSDLAAEVAAIQLARNPPPPQVPVRRRRGGRPQRPAPRAPDEGSSSQPAFAG